MHSPSHCTCILFCPKLLHQEKSFNWISIFDAPDCIAFNCNRTNYIATTALSLSLLFDPLKLGEAFCTLSKLWNILHLPPPPTNGREFLQICQSSETYSSSQSSHLITQVFENLSNKCILKNAGKYWGAVHMSGLLFSELMRATRDSLLFASVWPVSPPSWLAMCCEPYCPQQLLFSTSTIHG